MGAEDLLKLLLAAGCDETRRPSGARRRSIIWRTASFLKQTVRHLSIRDLTYLARRPQPHELHAVGVAKQHDPAIDHRPA